MAHRSEHKTYAQFRERLAKIDEATIAWFAGWLSADGSIKPGGPSWVPNIRFTICDRDPLDRFAELFGNKVYGPFKQSPEAFGARPVYEWKIAGQKAVLLLERCLPWLSERYAARARKAMQYKVRPHNGRKLTPTQVAEIRKALATGGYGTGRRLARKYGVSEGLISAIKVGRIW